MPLIKFVDMFSGIGGFREGLTRAGGFECVGHCEIDKYANRSYNALFDTKGEWFIEDARKADPSAMPDFQLLCGGFPCQTFSIAGTRKGFGDPRGTLFFELARLAEARKPSYLLFENVPGLLSHDGGRTFATILNTLDRLGYGVEWQCLNSKDFGVPQSRNRVYIIGYLDERCRGKVFPFTETAGSSLIQTHGGHQGERVYSPEGLSCTLAANPGGFGGKTGLYEVGVPIKCATKTGYQMAQVGDSIDLSYATVNSRRGRVGKEIAHGRLHRGKKPHRKLTGLRALYYRYLYELGALPRKPRRPSYAVRQDAYKLDQRIRQMEFLSKHNIDTLAQLETHRQALQTEIGQLLTKRKQLPKTDDVLSQCESVNTALKQLRQEERLCRKIAEHSLEVQQHLTEARRDRAEQQQREQEHERDRRPNIDLTL